MDENLMNLKTNAEEEYDLKIPLPQIIYRSVREAMTHIVMAFESIIRLNNIPVDTQNEVKYAQLVARDVTSRISSLTELFSDTSFVTRPNMLSYNLKQFLDVFTEHLNNFLKWRTTGRISYVIDENSDFDVIFDSKRVATILYYLISNSLQHGKTENKNVKILCKSIENKFEIILRDYGGGISTEIQPTLFSASRIAYDLEKQGLGMLPPRIQGLGLPLCQKLTKEMDGEISFKNYRGGAQFTIVLPQKVQGMQEVSEFVPNDVLLNECMLSFLLCQSEKKSK